MNESIEKTRHLWNKRELAQYLGLKIWTIDAWVCQRKIPFLKLGRVVRFDPDKIEKWLEEREVTPSPTEIILP